MYCDTYCKGQDTEVDCALSGSQKEQCVKSCLDCRSPNKLYCYCPTIFPPKAQQSSRQLQARLYNDLARLGDDDSDEPENDEMGEVNVRAATEDAKVVDRSDPNDESDDDVVFYVSIIIAVVVVSVLLAIFCMIRYKKRKKAGMDQSKAVEENPSKAAVTSIDPAQPRQLSRGHRPTEKTHRSPRNRDGSP